MADRPTTFHFELIFAAPVIPDGMENALFEAGCDDATISWRNGYVWLTFDRAGEGLWDAVASAEADVRKAGYEPLPVAMIEPNDLGL
jgi:hypothetical protein